MFCCFRVPSGFCKQGPEGTEKKKKRGQALRLNLVNWFLIEEKKWENEEKSKQSHIEHLGKKNYNCRKWRGEREKKGNKKKRKE